MHNAAMMAKPTLNPKSTRKDNTILPLPMVASSTADKVTRNDHTTQHTLTFLKEGILSLEEFFDADVNDEGH